MVLFDISNIAQKINLLIQNISDLFSNVYRKEPLVIYILLIELFLVVLYIAFPNILHMYLYTGGELLLTEPKFIDKEMTLGTFETLHNNGQRQYHYSVSAWFTINPQSSKLQKARLLSYGNKPRVEYDIIKNTLYVTTENHYNRLVNVAVIPEIKLQRWNHIVVNYDGGTMDVFLNGVIVGSTPGLSPFINFENILIGQKNGIEGGIKKVVYYKHIRPVRMILNEYNLGKLL